MNAGERPAMGRKHDAPLLLRQAKAAIRQGHNDEARRLLQAILHYDPTHDQALLGLVYLAKEGQASLAYLARLLDAHPHHPQARAALQWTRQRVPTSGQEPSRPGQEAPKLTQRPRKRVYGLALVGLLIALLAALGTTWQADPSPAASLQNDLSPATSLPKPSPTAQPQSEVVNISIPLFTSTPTPAATAPPPSAWVPVLGQDQTRNLSCESRSSTDLARYWGVAVGELEFLDALGQSDNPHKGFVGNVDMPPGSLPPYGYGVYAEPVAATLRDHGLDAHPVYRLGLDGIRAELLAGRPVLIWGTYLMEPFEPQEWVSSDGQTSTVVPFMHTFLVTGFDREGVFVLDAYDATVQYYSAGVFLKVWNSFDQMAVVVKGLLP